MKVLDSKQQEFLTTLMHDTWRFIDYACDPATGIPLDWQGGAGYTNSTPVGLYIASLAIANRLGMVTDDEATRRFEKVFGSMERLHQKHGFFPNFFPADLRSIPTDGVMIISDFNFYPVGLIVARQVWPQYADRIGAYLDSIEWERLYDKEANRVFSGYDLGAEKATIPGLWLACDARCAVMMMIGSGVAPPNVWEGTIRGPMETKTGTIYQPGFTFGVTYISAITGLFLPERDTEVGQTVGNLGWYQYQFSRRRGYPLWGWSNCMIPGRQYTAAGFIPEWTVTPHALSLLIDYYPRHATAALQKMQELGGDTPPPGYEGMEWGLRGCYDMERNVWGEKYLQLEQGMLFLALANYLHDGIVRDVFTSDPLIQKGLELSAPFLEHRPDLLERWRERDALPIEPTPLRMADDLEAAADTVHALDLSGLVPHQPDQIQITHDDGTTTITTVGDAEWKSLACAMAVPSLDIEHLDRIEFEIEVLESDTPQPGWLRLLLADRFGQPRFALLELDSGTTHYSLRARDIYGFFLDDDNLAHLTIQFERAPWFYQWHQFAASRFSLLLKGIRVITKE